VIDRVRAVVVALALAVVAGVSLVAADHALAIEAQVPPAGSTVVTAEEAPSSLTTGDQVRAFTVLGVSLAAMVIPVLLVARRSRRRRRASLRSDPGPP